MQAEKFPRDTAYVLKRAWKVKAEECQECRFEQNGKWYHPLKVFPAAYFDRNGYIIFAEHEYNQRGWLTTKDVHIPTGISKIPGYKDGPWEATPQNVKDWKNGPSWTRDDANADTRFERVASEAAASDATLETEIQYLVWRRKNAHRFAEPVIRRAGSRCALSGVEAMALLQACHIKPWSQSDDSERLDLNNGFCFAAHVHAAFDAQLIGVKPNGEVVYSNRLSVEDRARLDLPQIATIDVLTEQRPYLEYRSDQFEKAQGIAL